MKTLIVTGAAVAALMAGAASLHAQTPAEIFDSCKPHDWQRYGEAVEALDYAALEAMLREPELGACPEILASAGALVCANDPIACIEPAAGGPGPIPSLNPNFDPQPVPPVVICDECPGDFLPFGGLGPFPNQAPGQSYNGSRDHAATPTPSQPSAPSGTPSTTTSSESEGMTEG
jgi:hypothetical protein